MSEVFRLQLVERPNQMVEARAIGYAHATVPLPFGLEELAGLLTDGAYVRLGQALYDTLFPDQVRDALAEALAITRAERQPLALQLLLGADSPTLPRYPWELIHDGRSFLVGDGTVSLARFLDNAPTLVPAAVQAPLRVLLVAPRPADLAEADGRPGSAVLPALEELRRRGLLQVDVLSPPTYAAMRDVLSRGDYHLLHFDGASCPGGLDGEGVGQLVFEDDYAASSLVGGSTLHNALFLSRVRLAALTLSASGEGPVPSELGTVAPWLIRAGLPAVVAMQRALPGEQIERFAFQFYHSLATLTPVSTAVAYARGQLLPAESARFAPAVYLQDREGSGQLFVGKVEAGQARPLAHVPAAPGPVSAGYHPEQVFVDRAEAVVGALQALADPSRRLCLWGLGGVGKTAVAREVVRRGAWRFPGGVIWLGLQGGRSLASLLAEIADCYGALKGLAPLLEEARRQVSTLLAERVVSAGGGILLVLDNLEDVVADPDLQAFLAGLPVGVQVLATSRCIPEGGLWHTIELRAMAAVDIERILRQKVLAQRIPVSPVDEPLVPEISALLDGYPLGVDLVVSLARTCPWSHIRDELRAQPPPPLQAILRTTVGQGLSEEQRRIGARLSVLRGPFDGAALAKVSGKGDWQPAIQRLRELSLISFDGTTYAFDVPAREYLYGLLAPEEAQACHEQAYRHYAGRRDLDGLVEAYQQAIAAGLHEAARSLLRDKLMDALLGAGRYRQLLGLLDAALALPEGFDERFMLARAGVQRTLGRLPEALHTLEQVLAAPDLAMSSRALALHERGRICYDLDDQEQGDHQQALDLYAQALAICEDLAAADNLGRDERRWLDGEMAALLQDVAAIHQYALAGPQDLAFAQQLYSISSGFWKRLKDPVSRAISDMQRAEILRTGSAEEREEAKRIYRQVMQVLRRKGLESAYGDALLHLGKIYQDERALKHALKRFQEYEAIQLRLGLEREEAMAWKHQGEIWQEAGYRGRSVRRAIELYSRALERLVRYGDRWSRRTVVAALLRRGEAYLELRQPAEAGQDFRKALARSVAMGSRGLPAAPAAQAGEVFDVRRLSQGDRRRLLWAFCAQSGTASGDEGEACADLFSAALATARSLGYQGAGDLCQAPDCTEFMELPGWAVHHRAKPGARVGGAQPGC